MVVRRSSQDPFQVMTPRGNASSARLFTSHSSFEMDARRNSDASISMASYASHSPEYSMPPTPACTQSPLATESFDSTTYDLSQTPSLGGITMGFHLKTPGFDDNLPRSWTALDSTGTVDQNYAVRGQDAFSSQRTFLQSQMPSYVGMETTVTAPWCGTIPSTSYTTYESQMNMAGFDICNNTTMGSMWDIPTSQLQDMVAPTIVPRESMLGGDYVRIETPDLGSESYDDMDVPLPSPQQVVFKRETSPWVKPEPYSSDDEDRIERQIHETRTGGKTIRKDRRGAGLSKRKAKKDSPFYAELKEGVIRVSQNIVQDPRTGKYRYVDQQPRKKFCCQFPYDDDDENIPADAVVCGKLFQRPEHRQRHRRTHCPDKDFPCLLCEKNFNRNDNCWAHGFTHVGRPGKKDGRNAKFSLRQVISVLSDPKHIDKLLNDWKKEVGTEYDPEAEENDNENFMEAVQAWNTQDPNFRYNVDDAVKKILCHRM
ncbi:hypothetical protein ACN47E_004108 [Coniothyrium glycines]